jgi:hypothetical protein
VRAFPRRLVDEMQEIVGDVASPPVDELAARRRSGQL